MRLELDKNVRKQRPKFEREFFAYLKSHNVGIQNIKYPNYKHSSEINAWNFTSPSEKALILFLHATGHDALFPNTQFFKLLLNNGFSIFSFDLDGHGYSSNSLFDPSDFALSFQSAFQQVLKLDSKEKSIFVCGQSLGAVLGYSQLHQKSYEIKGFVGVAMPLAPPKVFSFLPELLLPLLPTFWEQLKYFSFNEILPPVLCFKRQQYPIRLKDSAKHYFLEISTYIAEASRSLKPNNTSPPCLFIGGQLDKIAALHALSNHHFNDQEFDYTQISLENHYSLMLSSKVHQSILKWLLEKLDE